MNKDYNSQEKHNAIATVLENTVNGVMYWRDLADKYQDLQQAEGALESFYKFEKSAEKLKENTSKIQNTITEDTTEIKTNEWVWKRW